MPKGKPYNNKKKKKKPLKPLKPLKRQSQSKLVKLTGESSGRISDAFRGTEEAFAKFRRRRKP